MFGLCLGMCSWLYSCTVGIRMQVLVSVEEQNFLTWPRRKSLKKLRDFTKLPKNPFRTPELDKTVARL